MDTLSALQRVVQQIPEQVRPLVLVSLRSDAFMLRPVAQFKTRAGNIIEAELEEDLVIPEATLVRLCLL